MNETFTCPQCQSENTTTVKLAAINNPAMQLPKKPEISLGEFLAILIGSGFVAFAFELVVLKWQNRAGVMAGLLIAAALAAACIAVRRFAISKDLPVWETKNRIFQSSLYCNRCGHTWQR